MRIELTEGCAERSIGTVLETDEPQGSGGSNPAPLRQQCSHGGSDNFPRGVQPHSRSYTA